MTHDATSTTSDDESIQGPRDRRESFPASGPVSARITTRSGDILVTHGDDPTVQVTLRATGSAAAHLLEQSEVRYDESTRTLYVVTAGSSVDARVGNSFGLGLGRRRSLLGAVMRDVDVSVVLPRASSVEVRTKSGDCALQGESGDVDVATASGDVMIDDARSAKVRTAAGDIVINRSRVAASASSASGDVIVRESVGQTKVESASGDVRAITSGDETSIATASGDVAVEVTGPGRVVVRSASGDVAVAVREGLDIDVVAHSVSGHLSSAIPLSTTATSSGGEQLSVTVATVSGDVKIVRA
ncbi:MAG: DUF4097 family beta strand repeat-containing protein [Acidimicrobiales bacterium]